MIGHVTGGRPSPVAPNRYHPRMLDRRIAWASAAALIGACTSTIDPPAPPAASSPGGAPSIDQIVIGDVEVVEPTWKPDGSNWRVVVRWTSEGTVAVDHYVVRRNGITVDGDVEATTFRDEDAEPGARYRYEITAVDAGGAISDPASIRLRTEEPPLADARLQGRFLVRMTVEGSNGTRRPVRGGAIVHAFVPACRAGPCAVAWSVRGARTEGRLGRDGAVYAADLRTPLFIRNCFGDVVDESLAVRLRVVRAAPLGHAWRATAVEGTIGEVSSYGGCLTATVDWQVRGSLQN